MQFHPIVTKPMLQEKTKNKTKQKHPANLMLMLEIAMIHVEAIRLHMSELLQRPPHPPLLSWTDTLLLQQFRYGPDVYVQIVPQKVTHLRVLVVPPEVREGRRGGVDVDIDARVAMGRPSDLGAAGYHVRDDPCRVIFIRLDIGDLGWRGVEDAEAFDEDYVADEGGVFGWGAGKFGVFICEVLCR